MAAEGVGAAVLAVEDAAAAAATLREDGRHATAAEAAGIAEVAPDHGSHRRVIASGVPGS